jgi:uncharacterized membrane protein YeaQ/YmgE (transglycosylase-associated protein family)
MAGLMWWVITTAVGGLMIGALGRLIIPKPNRTRLLGTALCGLGGSFLGGLLATVALRGPFNQWPMRIFVEVLVAAALVSLLARRHSHLA